MMTMGDKDVSCVTDGKSKSFQTGGSDIYLGVRYRKNTARSSIRMVSLSPLEEGQIALSKAALDRNKLEIGDTLILRSGDIEKEMHHQRDDQGCGLWQRYGGNDPAGRQPGGFLTNYPAAMRRHPLSVMMWRPTMPKGSQSGSISTALPP